MEQFPINEKWRRKTRDELKAMVEKLEFVNISSGAHKKFGISQHSFRIVLFWLRQEGYTITILKIVTIEGEDKYVKVLSGPGTNYREVWDHRLRIIEQN